MDPTIIVLIVLSFSLSQVKSSRNNHFSQTVHYNGCRRTYIVVTPKNINPGDDLKIPVHILAKPMPRRVTVTVQLLENTKERTLVAEVDGQATQSNPNLLLKLQVPDDLRDWSYLLNVFGAGALKFSNETTVYVRRKPISVFVQSDKAVYKPGDTVRLRVFALNQRLDRVDMNMSVNIFDSAGNKIEEANNVAATPVWKHELHLADMVILGRWRVEVLPKEIKIISPNTRPGPTKIKGVKNITPKCPKKKKKMERFYRRLLRKFERNVKDSCPLGIQEQVITDKNILSNAKRDYYFDIEYYVLPEFEVKVNLPDFGVTGDETLEGSVEAKYLTGAAVVGDVELLVSKPWSYGFYDSSAIRMRANINGEWHFQIPRECLELLTRDFQYRTLHVKALVRNTNTGKRLEGLKRITYHENSLKIAWDPNMASNFKPGFNFPVSVRVSQQDDSPAKNLRGKVTITATFFTEKPSNDSTANRCDFLSPFEEGQTILLAPQQYTFDKNGYLYLEDINVPVDAATGTIKAQYKDLSIYKEITRFNTGNNQYLKLEAVDQGQLAVNNLAIFTVKSSVGDISGHFLVTANNDIVHTGDFNIPDCQETELFFPITRTMVPSSRLVVYTVVNGEIIADGLTLAFPDMYENKVSVGFDPVGPVEPRTNVTLRVNAQPGSIVFIGTVDKGVKLLQEGNDITHERIERELGRYGNPPIIYYGWGRFRPWSFHVDDPFSVFNAAGVWLMTNANLLDYILQYRGPENEIILDRPMLPVEDNAVKSGEAVELEGLVRENFPETWRWLSGIVGLNGEVEFQGETPDTLTSWVAGAYAIDKCSGFGVALEPATLITDLPLYVKMRLPKFVVQGELVFIQADVYNGFQDDLLVSVTLRNYGEFVDIELDQDGNEVPLEGNVTHCILAKSGQFTPVFFPIIPLNIIGDMLVNVRLEERIRLQRFDEVKRYLLVKAEGEEMAVNTPVLISHTTPAATNKQIQISYPADTVPKSERIEVAITGDLFGIPMENIRGLISMPSGCGEQNMIRFAPAVIAISYLKIIGRFETDAAFKTTALDIMKTGYQRQMLYVRHDGSFSAFGNADTSGSTWLTAFVIQMFAQAFSFKLITIDSNVFEEAVNYIVGRQEEDGSFREEGKVIHKLLQGGSAESKVVLTAYIVIGLQAVVNSGALSGPTKDTVEEAIDQAVAYLNNNIPSSITDYLAAICAVANPNNSAYLAALVSSENRTLEGGLHWGTQWGAQRVEIAAYALTAYARKNDKLTGILILEFLVNQMSKYGGYRSTQDTVIGLQALAEFAAMIYSGVVDMTIDVALVKGGNTIESRTFTLNTENHDRVQYYYPENGTPDTVDITGIGIGVALIYVTKVFNIYKEPGPQTYELNVISHPAVSRLQYMITVCTRFIPPDETTGMSIMSIGAVSGFEPSKDVTVLEGIAKKVETNDDVIDLYFEEMTNEAICVEVTFDRQFIVAGHKMANVKVYSYYNPDEEHAMERYIPDLPDPGPEICAVCGVSCGCGPNSAILPLEDCYGGN